MARHSSDFDEICPTTPVMLDAERLLLEWMRWWYLTEEAPPKMPDGLHVRTSMYFVKRRMELDSGR